MKKLFAVLALVAVMTSCKDKKKEEKKPDATTTTTTTTEPSTTTTTTTTTTTDGVPTFKDAEVQKFVNDYTVFVNAYVAAYKTKDYTKIAAVANNVTEWTTKTSAITQKLIANPQEAQAFSSYMSKLSEQMIAATKPQ